MEKFYQYLGKRLFWYLLTFVVALMLNFFLPRAIPGNPVDALAARMMQVGITNADAMAKVYENFTKEFGMDKPLATQFLIFVGNLFNGNLGRSFSQYPRTVTSVLKNAMGWTLAIQIPGIICGWILGNILGAVAAYKRGVFDGIIFPVSLFINSMPFYVMAILLVYFFSIMLGWFPTGGGYGTNLFPSFRWEFIASLLHHYWLPFSSIVLVAIGGQAIGMRSMAIYELNTDYVQYSKLMGIKDNKIVGYVFRNAMLPQITGLIMSLGTMMSGAMIVEIVFGYPGVGHVLFAAIRNNDYPVISGCTLVITITVLIANLALEIVLGLMDPRIRAQQLEGG